MSAAWPVAAACCAAIAVWMHSMRGGDAGRLDVSAYGRTNIDAGSSWTMLILRMVQVALCEGASIPGTLQSVGRAIGGECGDGMERVGAALNRGASWADAWGAVTIGTIGESNDRHHVMRRDTDEGRKACETLSLVRAALESSWNHGDAPGIRLDAAIEQWDRDERAAIERHAASLSVKLLMPTGLCFLPAFVLIGIIPAIVSFVM